MFASSRVEVIYNVCMHITKKKFVHILKELELTDIFQWSKSTFKKDVALYHQKKKKKTKEIKVALAHRCHYYYYFLLISTSLSLTK